MRVPSVVLLVAVGFGSPAVADPPLATLSTDLDGDGRAESLSFAASGQLTHDNISTTLKGGPFVEASLSATVVDGHRVVMVRARAAEPEVVLLVEGAKLQPIVAERIGFDADHERERVIDVTAGGITRFWRTPSVRRCDGETRMFVERWSFTERRFVDAPPPPPHGVELTGRAVGVERPRPVFRFSGASTDEASAATRLPSLAAPHELEDGKPTTWTGGAGDWVVAGAPTDRYAVRAVAVVTAPRQATRHATLILDEGLRFSFTLPPGGTQVDLPAPARSRCVALVVDGPAVLSEVRIFTEADGADGLQRLVAAIAADDDASAATAILQHERAAASALVATLPTAIGAGRRRVAELLAQLAVPSTAPGLVAALRTAARGEETALVSALAAIGDAALIPLEAALTDDTWPPPAHQAALSALVAMNTPTAKLAILGQIGRGDAAERAQRRNAVAGRLDAVLAERALTAVRDPATPLHRALDLLTAVAESHTVGALDGAALSALAARIDANDGGSDDDRFAARLQLIQAAKQLGHSAAPLLPWLATPFEGAGGDVLRQAAFVTRLAVDDAPEHALAVWRAAVADPSPRVRRAALTALGDGAVDAAHEALVAGAFADRWPMVRRAAADSARLFCTGGRSATLLAPLAQLMLADPATETRRAALGSIAVCAPAHAAVTQLLADARQPASLREAAVAVLVRHHVPGAAAKIAAAIRATLDDPSADEQSTWLVAGCLHGLGHLGDKSQPALDAITAAAAEPLSAIVRAAAVDAIGSLCPRGAQPAIAGAAKDPDPRVRQAAGRAAARCH